MIKIKTLIFFLILPLILNSCNGKIPGADARKVSYDSKERVKKNLEEGKGFRMDSAFGNNSGTFDFASSNELWRASLDTIDFMPLVSANYSGGIVITDWYAENNIEDEAIKISVRFLSNEIRADALDIKIFLKQCNEGKNCQIRENKGELSNELRVSILKKAAKYEKEGIEKNKKENPYHNANLDDKN